MSDFFHQILACLFMAIPVCSFFYWTYQTCEKKFTMKLDEIGKNIFRLEQEMSEHRIQKDLLCKQVAESLKKKKESSEVKIKKNTADL